jgi:glyoxylate reductase
VWWLRILPSLAASAQREADVPDPAPDEGRILVTHELPGGLGPLDGLDVRVPEQEGDRSELLALVADVDAMVCPLMVEVDEELLDAAPDLRVVANVAVGYDNVDVGAATERGVLVTNTPEVLDDTTADLAFALILAASRRLSDAERWLRAGEWEGSDLHQWLGVDIHGATLGIVGYGRIGRAVARRARGFAMTVLHHTRTPTGEDGWVEELEELLDRSQIISLHVPLTEQTRQMIGARELELLGSSGVLVNTARGEVLDEDALADALESGTIFAAGLDVHADEPGVHPRLLRTPNTVLLPHIGSASHATREEMARLAQRSARDALAGSVPDNTVNPEAWES